MTKSKSHLNQRQLKLHEIIFEAETPAGKLFDVLLIGIIVLSVIAVMLDSVQSIQDLYGEWLYWIEWIFTAIFTVEYGLRLYCIGKPKKYAWSFFGIIDLLAILPTYLSLFLPGTHFLTVIRVLRVLRIFRVLKIVQYVGEAALLIKALRASRRKIEVFLFAVLTLTIILGSFMYIIEGPEHGFTSIPKGMYWAIATLSTVGYGDMSPQTDFGQVVASLVMIMGYGILAVPTGIVTVELSNLNRSTTTQSCPECSLEGHDNDARYCKFCGANLEPEGG